MGTNRTQPSPVAVATLVLAIGIASGCGDDPLDSIYQRNGNNLSYEVVVTEQDSLAMVDDLAAAGAQAYTGPLVVIDDSRPDRSDWHRWCRYRDQGQVSQSGCQGIEPTAPAEVLTVSLYRSSTFDEDRVGLAIEHKGPNWRFEYNDVFGWFSLTLPTSTFPPAADHYLLETGYDWNLPPLISERPVGSQREDVGRYLESPESFLEHATLKIESLRTQALGYLDDGLIRRLNNCRTVEGFEGVTRRECDEVELTEEEEDGVRQIINQEVDRMLAEVEGDHQRAHQLLVAATLAAECDCWP